MLNQSGLKKNRSHKLLLLVLLILAGSCSTDKNTAVTRTYHNITSRYNIYFNGKESVKSGLVRMDQAVDDDFTRLLPVYKSSLPGTERLASAEMDNAILKASKLIKLHSLTKKPKRRKNRTAAYKNLAGKDEYNVWVDDSYVLMGTAYFYQKKFPQAMENFNYVLRKFPDEKTRFDALVWLIRCYSEQGRFADAQEMIKEIDGKIDFPKRLNQEFSLAVADFHLKQHEYDEAIPALKSALNSPMKKADKARCNYILAQLYKETNQNEQAIAAFRQVGRLNPSYKMSFNARINAAGVFTETADSRKTRKELKKMLNDEKNAEFRDQIYFALANIEKREGNEPAAIGDYRLSSASSISNNYQKALSCLTLADIYFQKQEYNDSRAYYDSAMLVIDETYPNYAFINERHKSLITLSDNLLTVAREDSLQTLARMSETERTRKIDGWIKAERDAELRRKQAENQEQMDRNFYRMNESRLGLSQSQQGSGWYFYNPSTVTLGKAEFEQKWGKRKLEDNWRRKNKSQLSPEMIAEEAAAAPEDSTAKEAGPVRVNDRLSRDFYLQDVPLTPDALRASDNRIRDALFNAGRIFKQDYRNYPKSVEEYEDLLRRYDNNIYQLTTYFELWDLYARLGNQAKSNDYRSLIVNRYPESKYAQYLVNPNYFIELEAHTDSINRMYQQAYALFREGKYAQAGQAATLVKQLKPDSTLMPRIAFIETIGQGEAGDLNRFGRLLDDYLSAYPVSPVKPMAEQLRRLVADSTLTDYRKLVETGYLSNEIVNPELLANNKVQDEFNGKFSYDEELIHYFVVAFDRSAGVDLNRLKFDIANYNIDHYTKIDFDLETENLDANTILLTVRSLENKEQALIYFRSIIRKREVFETLKDTKYVNFVISTYNYRELKSDHSSGDYLRFFVKNYSRFIGGDFPEDVLPEPEVLMEQARQEEQAVEERGSFVLVKADTREGEFTREPASPHSFVIAVKDAKFNLRGMQTKFDTFNRGEAAGLKLTTAVKTAGDYQLLVVRPLASAAEAMDYFRKVITTRSLFGDLGDRSYRNFIVSDGNLEAIGSTKAVDSYLDFFRSYYISGQAAAAPATGSIEVKTETAPVYSGPFNPDKTGKHDFVLLVPEGSVDAGKLADAIETHNDQADPAGRLQIESKAFTGGQLMFRVSAFDSSEAAMNYLRNLVRDAQVFGSLAEVEYRNFIISETNFGLLTANKQLADYLSFYKTVYLGN